MDTYFIHAHGRVCTLKEAECVFAVPKNCVIISLCDYVEFLDDDHVNQSIFLFQQKVSSMLRLLQDPRNFVEEEVYVNIKDIFSKFITSLLDAQGQNPNRFCVYLPGYLFNNMSLMFRDKNGNFPAGIYPPFTRECAKVENIIQHLKYNNTESIHQRFLDPPNAPRVDLRTIVNTLCCEAKTKINVFFVLACNNLTRKRKEEGLLHTTNKLQLTCDNFDKIVKDMLIQYYLINPDKVKDIPKDHIEYLGLQQQGGTPHHSHYVVKQEKQTNRRYVVIKRRKWFLDENKNRYRYDTRFANKTVIILKTALTKDGNGA